MLSTLASDIERGAELSASALGRADILRTIVYHRKRQFFERHYFFVMPVCQVDPFDISQQFISQINGIDLPSYTDWMKSCYLISRARKSGNFSSPPDLRRSGLPVGLQIVSRGTRMNAGCWRSHTLLNRRHRFSQLRPPVARVASPPQAAS